MPYRVDIRTGGRSALDRLIELGALDVDDSSSGGVAAIMPDTVTPDQVARAVGLADVAVSRATGRDADSVWILTPRPISIGPLRIVPSDHTSDDSTLRLIDAPAFGTGLHPTTASCIEALLEIISRGTPHSVLDVGTGSGVLALAALRFGVPHAVGIDVDGEALRIAAENARINGLTDRLQLTRGGPDAISGSWPLVLANVLAAPLIEMAPVLVRRVAHQGTLVLSGIAASLERDVERTYRDVGMRRAHAMSRGGWRTLVLGASW